MKQEFSILVSKDEFFLEPCMNLLFISLYFYCANDGKVTYSSNIQEVGNVGNRKGVNEKLLFFYLWNK